MRRIILCADDYGIAPGVNAAIRSLIGKGRLNATSVMTVAPSLDQGSADALGVLNIVKPSAAIGLHLTLTAPFQPLSEGFRPLRDGAFLPLAQMLVRAMARQLDAEALARETAAQLARFAQLFGRPPDYIDGHQHVHLFPQVRDAVLTAAKRDAPGAWVRQCGRASAGRSLLADPKGALLDSLSRSFRERAAAAGIATNPGFAGTYTFADDADFAALFPQFLEGLPDGGLIMCHPGHVDEELQRLDPLTALREREFAYLDSERFSATLAATKVTLLAGGKPAYHLSDTRRP